MRSLVESMEKAPKHLQRRRRIGDSRAMREPASPVSKLEVKVMGRYFRIWYELG